MLANLLTNRTVILISAFVGGLVFSDVAGRLGTLTMPALAVVLTVSTTQLSARDFLPLRRVARPVLSALLLNFGLLGSLILLLAWWLMPTRELWIGYVLVAAAPPGVAIIPFTHILRGDLRLSFVRRLPPEDFHTPQDSRLVGIRQGSVWRSERR